MSLSYSPGPKESQAKVFSAKLRVPQIPSLSCLQHRLYVPVEITAPLIFHPVTVSTDHSV